MLDYELSTHLNNWLFTPEHLNDARKKANHEARMAMASFSLVPTDQKQDQRQLEQGKRPKVKSFACQYTYNRIQGTESSNAVSNGIDGNDDTEWKSHPSRNSQPLLSTQEEELLLQYYSDIIPKLIGPNATSSRLRKQDNKIPATANLFFRRFFLSNSVMWFDPKIILVACCFLSSKIEESMVHVQYLIDAALEMKLFSFGGKNTTKNDFLDKVLKAECALLQGIQYQLVCYHPYKAVLSLREDLRTFLKSKDGQKLATIPNRETEFNNNEQQNEDPQERQQQRVVITGGDLAPIYEEARKIVENICCVSDIPLLFTSGQIGLACFIYANQKLLNSTDAKHNYTPKIDYEGYIHHLAMTAMMNDGDSNNTNSTTNQTIPAKRDLKRNLQQTIDKIMKELVPLLALHDEKKKNEGVDLDKLKKINKKLKKCRLWVNEKDESGGGEKKKKKKKRTSSATAGDKNDSQVGGEKAPKKQKLG